MVHGERQVGQKKALTSTRKRARQWAQKAGGRHPHMKWRERRQPRHVRHHVSVCSIALGNSWQHCESKQGGGCCDECLNELAAYILADFFKRSRNADICVLCTSHDMFSLLPLHNEKKETAFFIKKQLNAAEACPNLQDANCNLFSLQLEASNHNTFWYLSIRFQDFGDAWTHLSKGAVFKQCMQITKKWETGRS